MTASSTMHVAATTTGDEMDVDMAVGSSVSIGKHKHGDDDGHTHDHSDGSLHLAPLSSIRVANFHSLIAPSASMSSGPTASSVQSAPSASSTSFHNSVIPPGSKKKKTALTHNSAGRISSSMAPQASGNIAMKITPAVAIHGMQGTLNRLTDIMERNITIGPSSSTRPQATPALSLRTRAILLLQTRNDNLSTSEKTKVIRKFTKDIELAEVYVALEDDELRQDWLHDLLMSGDSD